MIDLTKFNLKYLTNGFKCYILQTMKEVKTASSLLKQFQKDSYILSKHIRYLEYVLKHNHSITNKNYNTVMDKIKSLKTKKETLLNHLYEEFIKLGLLN